MTEQDIGRLLELNVKTAEDIPADLREISDYISPKITLLIRFMSECPSDAQIEYKIRGLLVRDVFCVNISWWWWVNPAIPTGKEAEKTNGVFTVAATTLLAEDPVQAYKDEE